MIWIAALLVVALLLLLLSPLIRLVVTAVHDALFPLAKTRAPYAVLPPSHSKVPEDLITFDSNRTGNFEIYTMRSNGKDVTQLTHDPKHDSWWARISPDRRHILFYRSPRGVHDRDPTKNSLWVMDASGSNQLEIRPRGTDGWRLQGHAEWSHDGTELVMAGGSRTNPQVYVTTNTGRDPRNISNHGGTNIDPSWSIDDRSIYFIRCPGSFCTPGRQEVYVAPASGKGEQRRLTHDGFADYDPYESPAGSRLAWLTQNSNGSHGGTWNIRILQLPDGKPEFVTHDDNINSRPQWSYNGDEIFFHRLVKKTDDEFSIWSVAPDGRDLREITTGQPGANEYPGT